MVDTYNAPRLVETGDAHPVVRAKPVTGFAQGGSLRGLALNLRRLLLVLNSLPFGLVLCGQRLGSGLLGLGAEFLEAQQLRRLALLLAQVLAGAPKQPARQLQPAGDLQRI